MIEVSIVVPVYNVEKYLDRCLKSLVNQTLENIEIILVDDGSSDNSPVMCDLWRKKDSRIKVIHKENGGLSSARNAGIKIASGRYIGFVDSDDDVELDMYEKMYIKAEKYTVDFVMSDYVREINDEDKYNKSLNIDAGYYDKNKIVNDIFPDLIMGRNIDYGPLLSVWHCIYKRNFLLHNNITFNEKVKWSEDNLFSAIVGYRAESFYYMKNQFLYHYYKNPGTITTGYRKGAWEVYKLMNSCLYDYFDNEKEYDFHNQLNIHLIYYACNVISMSVRNHAAREAINRIKKILNDSDLQYALNNVKNLKISFKLRVQIFLMKNKLTYILFMMIKRRK